MLEKWKRIRGYQGHWLEQNVEQLELAITDEKYPFVVEKMDEEVADEYWQYHLQSLNR
ncbi:hypothetical protein JQC72_03850 [Polycladomyces sp. WAk]|uniref:Uncharacterized protein n=1 Tax=Polycladomyces zharkentensis TaxID=2807616 RepID=A0ABS2WGJ9_9BACL|nr:hypothetical protein [Polycladomyces sp. WAk]MBN2908652.1 hypothetical protein [Polycladomyces sp. WAk]